MTVTVTRFISTFVQSLVTLGCVVFAYLGQTHTDGRTIRQLCIRLRSVFLQI